MPDRIADLTIRPSRADDVDFVRTLASRAFAAYARDPARGVLSTRDEAGTEALIAELGSLRVGFVVLRHERLSRDFGPWTRPAVARIDAIAVRHDAQGRGIGRSLLDRAEVAARAQGARALSLATAEKNVQARRLFDATGFFTLLRVERYYAGGQAAVLMHKALI